MEVYFPDDTYTTPPDTPRLFLDKLFLNTRFYFFAGFFKRVFQAWRLARQGRYDRQTWARSSYDFFQFIEGCRGRFHLEGLDHLQTANTPCVIVSNHMSSLETAVMPAIIAPKMPITFVAKSSLVKYPFFGGMIAATHPILVARENPRADFEIVMREGLAWLAQGTSVVIYPQSTRTAVFDPKAFNSMGPKLARRAGVPLLPAAVKTDYWANGQHLRDFGPIHRDRPIHIAFGRPFRVEDSGKQAHLQVITFIQNHLELWGAD